SPSLLFIFRKMIRSISTILLLTLFATGCNKPQSFEYRGMQNFKIDSVGLVNSKISLDLVYFNPNNFGVELRNVTCDVYINHNYLGKYVLDTLMHIPKRSEFFNPFGMQVDMKNIFKNGFGALFSNEVLVELKGSTRLGKA